jgi:hypothetical protein
MFSNMIGEPNILKLFGSKLKAKKNWKVCFFIHIYICVCKFLNQLHICWQTEDKPKLSKVKPLLHVVFLMKVRETQI